MTERYGGQSCGEVAVELTSHTGAGTLVQKKFANVLSGVKQRISKPVKGSHVGHCSENEAGRQQSADIEAPNRATRMLHDALQGKENTFSFIPGSAHEKNYS
jgi:hypothetical protein